MEGGVEWDMEGMAVALVVALAVVDLVLEGNDLVMVEGVDEDDNSLPIFPLSRPFADFNPVYNMRDDTGEGESYCR